MIINLNSIKKFIKKFERKITIDKKEKIQSEKIVNKLEKYENIIKHFKSRAERICLKSLED